MSETEMNSQLVASSILDAILQGVANVSCNLPAGGWLKRASNKRSAKKMEQSEHSPRKRHRVETVKERLQRLQELRINDGTWVECCNAECGKWRYLSEVKDPTEVPKFWTCKENTDPLYSTCDAPEQQCEKIEEMVLCKFTAGSVVWARMAGYPWWPGLVDDCPDTETFFWPYESTNTDPQWYNVTFFDHCKTNLYRAWIPAGSVQPFWPGKDAPQGQISKRMSSQLAKSVKEAEFAYELNVVERRKKFSFLARHSGQLGEAIGTDTENV